MGTMAGLAVMAVLVGTPAASGPGEILGPTMRKFLVAGLPNPLYDAKPGWGQTTQIVNGLRWEGHGLKTHPVVSHGDRNHGVWKHVTVTAPGLADTLLVDVRNYRREGPATRFDLFLAMDVEVMYIHQKWDKGVKLFDGEVRAKLRLKVLLTCEITTRMEKGAGLLPDVVYHLRVPAADVDYDNLKITHLPGVGGEAAKVLGDLLVGTIKQVKPSLEKHLLERGEAAIMKAGADKEFRLKLGSLPGLK
jgi:hypothetical protein